MVEVLKLMACGHNGGGMRQPFYAFLLLAMSLAAQRPNPAQAHPIGTSGLRLLIWNDHCKAILTLHTRDLSEWFFPTKNPDYSNDLCRKLVASPADLLEVHFDDRVASPTEKRTFLAEEGLIQVELTYPISTMPARLGYGRGISFTFPPATSSYYPSKTCAQPGGAEWSEHL